MKNLRQELIEFLTDVKDWNYDVFSGSFKYEAERLLNEINSNESNEFRTVGNNENTQEKCFCYLTFETLKYMHYEYCPHCGRKL